MTTIALPKRGENKYETDWSRWARNLAKDGVIYGELDELKVEGIFWWDAGACASWHGYDEGVLFPCSCCDDLGSGTS